MAQRPLFSVLEALERRWAMRIVWELRRDALGFGELRGRLGISPSVLAERLRDLEGLRVVGRDGSRRYVLTGRGRELARILYELNRWAESPGRAQDRPAESAREAGDVDA